jgi:hypothetical protein
MANMKMIITALWALCLLTLESVAAQAREGRTG